MVMKNLKIFQGVQIALGFYQHRVRINLHSKKYPSCIAGLVVYVIIVILYQTYPDFTHDKIELNYLNSLKIM